MDQSLEIVKAFQPDYLVLSLGFDIIHGDPIGGFDISIKGLAMISSRIANLNLPTVIVQEGGYLIEKL
ncbi:MAG: histone deacetylase family protein, partial [candidate division Zixibacteria bacterium]|nr:histone deacetylase family protein [candidate division Zixibacteria bacterium]